MSSKEQFRDALKRANAEIKELKNELTTVNIKNINLHGRIEDLQAIIKSLHTVVSRRKKWWQFWK